MLEVRPLAIPDVLEILPQRISDQRGFFSEVWSARAFDAVGLDMRFVQDNHSRSRQRGVLRGLHFQAPPHAQAKLVRVTRGAVFDVAADLRPTSPTYRQWTSLILSEERWNQILVPAGFAHGFLTLEEDTEVQYKVTAPYSQAHDCAVRFDDPAIGIDWPIPAGELILSDKDSQAPLLADIDTGF